METILKSPFHHRITQKRKDANDYEWYKHQIDMLDSSSFGAATGFGGIPESRRMQANYDLYNNIIDKEDFAYVCKPYGDAVGELPANFVNRDITSGKIKVLLGMEMKRPFSWKVVAVNEEATTRKEQEEFGRIKEWVISEIMGPIIAATQMKAKQQTQGRELSQDEQRQIQQQVQQEIQAATPEEVRRYMQRNHQDPAEALGHQLLEYLIQKLRIQDVFNDAWKHALLSGIEVCWIGEGAEAPMLKVVNPLAFDYDRSPDNKYIEDGEWACAEYAMTPSQIISMFSNELTEDEIDKIYSYSPLTRGDAMASPVFEDWSFRDGLTSNNTIRVFHANFKSLKLMQFLTYIDPKTGKEAQTQVNEYYKLNKEAGDIEIEQLWIPESHEGYKIGPDIYKRMRPVPGQYKDLNDLYSCKLSYRGAAYDNMNSELTSLMDRMKPYQFYFNIIMYRIEMLMASDKGKILMMNMNLIPKSQGVDLSKWLYYAESLKIGFLNPNEEGNRGAQGDVTNAVKEIDMSLVSDIDKYINFASYIEEKCGSCVGITKQMEGQIGPDEAVKNSQLNYNQSGYIIEPYFELHNQVKRNILEGVLENAKVFYSGKNADKLTYVIDDLSTKLLTLNSDLLDNSAYGLFVSNSSKAWDAKQAVQQLSQAAMQNQKAELSDIVKIIRSESVQEAEELLAVAEDRADEKLRAAQDSQNQAAAQEAEKERAFEREKFEQEKEITILKETERRKTIIQAQTIASLAFDPNKDEDSDGTPDVIEVAKHGLDAEIRRREQALEENKFTHQVKQDAIEDDNKKEELRIKEKQANKKPSNK